jgi:hypothetical protein
MSEGLERDVRRELCGRVGALDDVLAIEDSL